MTTRDKISRDALNLAEKLSPALPGTVEELWEIIEDTLDLARADAFAAGSQEAEALYAIRIDELERQLRRAERGPRDSIDI